MKNDDFQRIHDMQKVVMDVRLLIQDFCFYQQSRLSFVQTNPTKYKQCLFYFLPMPQLQNLYESILDVRFDRRNFSNKMLHLGILDQVGDRPDNASSRIPVNYCFNKNKYEELKSKGFRLEF